MQPTGKYFFCIRFLLIFLSATLSSFLPETVNKTSSTSKTALLSQKQKTEAIRRQLEKTAFDTPVVAITKKEVCTQPEGCPSPFKKAILDVFNSFKESNFYSVKGNFLERKNFWNYQFTYSTKIKIPGEKFNMLYSFPFSNSPLDFVSVLKESDAYDNSFVTLYHSFEKKLLETFPANEGWAASCIPNKESKTLSDLELRNDKYGGVVLDFSKNPKGRYILYLRFLLYQ